MRLPLSTFYHMMRPGMTISHVKPSGTIDYRVVTVVKTLHGTSVVVNAGDNPSIEYDERLPLESVDEHMFIQSKELESLNNDGRKALSFGQALEITVKGYRIQRTGWNGKGMFVVAMDALHLPPYNTQGTARKVNDRTARWIGEDTPLDCVPYMAMFTADKKWVCGWLASQTDMLADDWIFFQ